MANLPADVGCSPENLARMGGIEVVHRPFEDDRVTAIVAHHALRRARRTGGIEDVERVGCLHRTAIDRFAHRFRPVYIAARFQISLGLRTLKDDDEFWLR